MREPAPERAPPPGGSLRTRPWKAICGHLAALALLVAAAGTGPAGASPPGTASGSRPNILVILVDTLRADRLSFYGHRRETAPFLAGLAKEGVVFERALSSSSKTAPAVASLFTSLYPEHHGVVLGRAVTRRLAEQGSVEITLNRIPEAIDTLAEILKGAGYSTWCVADNYNVSEEMGFAQGFGHFVSELDFDRGSAYINGILKRWKRKILRSEPYFLYVHYMEPHAPYQKQEQWYHVDREDVRTTHYNGTPLPPDVGWRRAKWIWRYDSEIGLVDQSIREAYEMFGSDGKTLFVFLSDHGEEFWDHGGLGHGGTLFDELVRIPLFFHHPGGGLQASRIATPVSIVDVLPTLAEIAGVPLEGPHHGQSLLAELRGGDAPGGPARVLFAHTEGYPTMRYVAGGEKKAHTSHFVVRAAMRGRWKLIRDTRALAGYAQVFDIAADPGELKNLRTRESGVAVELSSRLNEFLAQAKVFDPESFKERLSEEEIEKLRTLGYVE